MTGPAGPRVVAVGGGRGLSVTLAAARRYAAHTTAVVATADDSGSTGRLRTALSMPAPGDLRRCITALAGAEDEPLGQALEYRFGGTDVEGHALGNLLLAALHATSGDFVGAVDELGRLLGLDPRRGRVVPATTGPVGLWGATTDGTVVTGQYAVSQTPGIVRVGLDPPGTKAPDGLVDAVHAADQVVLGPGSVYTSVLAATLVEDLGTALDRTTARCVYVCNLVPEQAETLGYDVAAHVRALHRHGVRPDTVLVQAGGPLALGDPTDLDGTEVVVADVASSQEGVHDVSKLADALTALALATPSRSE